MCSFLVRKMTFTEKGIMFKKYCPVALLERYILMADIDLNSSLPLFRPVRFYQSSNTYKLYGTKLSYTRCREIVKSFLKDLRLDDKLYGLRIHNVRSGEATSVVNNSPNLSDRLLKPGEGGRGLEYKKGRGAPRLA